MVDLGAMGNCQFSPTLIMPSFQTGSPDDEVILLVRFGCSAVHQCGFVFSNNIATFNGKLFWTVIYYSNVVSDAAAQKFANLAKGTILKAIEEFKDY